MPLPEARVDTGDDMDTLRADVGRMRYELKNTNRELARTNSIIDRLRSKLTSPATAGQAFHEFRRAEALIRDPVGVGINQIFKILRRTTGAAGGAAGVAGAATIGVSLGYEIGANFVQEKMAVSQLTSRLATSTRLQQVRQLPIDGFTSMERSYLSSNIKRAREDAEQYAPARMTYWSLVKEGFGFKQDRMMHVADQVAQRQHVEDMMRAAGESEQTVSHRPSLPTPTDVDISTAKLMIGQSSNIGRPEAQHSWFIKTILNTRNPAGLFSSSANNIGVSVSDIYASIFSKDFDEMTRRVQLAKQEKGVEMANMAQSENESFANANVNHPTAGFKIRESRRVVDWLYRIQRPRVVGLRRD